MQQPKNKNSYWWMILLVAIIVAVVLYFVLSKKKNYKIGAATQPSLPVNAKDKFGGDVVKIGPSTDIMVVKPKSETALITMTGVK